MLKKIKNGIYAYLQPINTWGFNNAGLIIEKDQSLLIDTLYDEKSTLKMLEEIKNKTGINNHFNYLINTHANGDHWFGNNVVHADEIIATKETIKDMKSVSPSLMADALKPSLKFKLLYWLKNKKNCPLDRYFKECFDAFDFQKIKPLYPTQIINNKKTLHLDNLVIELIDLGPAHTKSDLIVWIPEKKVVFTSDILFNDSTPIMWEGPVENWINACDYLINLKAEYYIPGHGAIINKIEEIKKIRSYFEHLLKETETFYKKGYALDKIIQEIDTSKYQNWTESERTAANIAVIYCKLTKKKKPSSIDLFSLMANYKYSQQ